MSVVQSACSVSVARKGGVRPYCSRAAVELSCCTGWCSEIPV